AGPDRFAGQTFVAGRAQSRRDRLFVLRGRCQEERRLAQVLGDLGGSRQGRPVTAQRGARAKSDAAVERRTRNAAVVTVRLGGGAIVDFATRHFLSPSLFVSAS